MRVLLVGRPALDPETTAAAAWLVARDLEHRVVSSDALSEDDLAWAGVVWCHAADWPAHAPRSPALHRLLTTRGGALLSLGACVLPHDSGLDPIPPSVDRRSFVPDEDPLWDAGFRDWPGFPHIRGLQAWSGATHPLFDGFQGGTFTRQLQPADATGDVGCDWPAWPGGPSGVIAVERAYVKLNDRRAVAWEYSVGDWRLLCLGAHVQLITRDSSLSAQRDRLLLNALMLVARRTPVDDDMRYWPRRARGAPRHSAPAIALPAVEPLRSDTEPRAVTTADPDAPFTLAGERALVVGTERGGVQEIWIHPLAVVSGGIRLSTDGGIPAAEAFHVSPVEVVRTLSWQGGHVRERIVPSLRAPCVLLEYLGDVGTSLTIEFTSRLRLEWPYSPDALQPLSARVEQHPGGLHTIAALASDGRHVAMISVEGAAQVRLDGADRESAAHVVVHAAGGARLRLLFAAGTQGVAALAGSVDRQNPIAAERERHAHELSRRAVSVDSPDEVLNVAAAWAVQRLAMFVAATPDGSRGLMAGYAASRDGWSLSRPGYAWFFARDACWSADAMLAVGLFEEVRDVLCHLAGTRDITGKIYHELTTSGAAHYDAADATPLFLRLAGTYHAWSGDADTIHKLWPAIRQAFDFVLSTDCDGDGLPENTNVGHGWIESGPLGGGHVTSYMAAVWVDALRHVLMLADAVGDAGLASAAHGALGRATRAVDARLRDAVSGRLALQLNVDGSALTDLTALSAVPVALGVDAGAGARDTLDALTSPAFCAPWGVRMLPTSDARYAPRGYHAGAVWPLFTGWTSLACFVQGRSEDGFRLLRANASLVHARAKGAFDEVLNGDTGEGAGICPDQAWSAAMVVAPLIRGAWGIEPLRAGRSLRIRLQLPAEWWSSALRSVRVGDSRFDIAVRRERNGQAQRVAVELRRAAGTVSETTVEWLVPPQHAVRCHVSDVEAQAASVRPAPDGSTWHGWAVAIDRSVVRLDIQTAPKP